MAKKQNKKNHHHQQQQQKKCLGSVSFASGHFPPEFKYLGSPTKSESRLFSKAFYLLPIPYDKGVSMLKKLLENRRIDTFKHSI